MKNQVRGRTLFCMFGECENLALFGGYCKDHQLQRAEAAEARADRLSALNLDAANKIEELETRIAGLDRGLAKSDEIIAQLEAERDQLLRHNDNLIKEVAQWRIHVEHVEAERDDLRAKLNEAMAIARGFVAERDEARRQLDQAREASFELGRTLQFTRIGWDDTVTCEGVLEPINKIAFKIGDALGIKR